jgi:hypothetical protein
VSFHLLKNQKFLHLKAANYCIVNSCSGTSAEQTNTETQLAFNIAMQFSHIVSLLFAAATRSGMKDVHLAGHSCFRTYYIATIQNTSEFSNACIFRKYKNNGNGSISTAYLYQYNVEFINIQPLLSKGYFIT